MKNQKLTLIMVATISLVLGLSQCKIIRPGEVGIKTKLGKMNENALWPGVHWINPFLSRVFIFNTRVQEYSANLHLPTKEGLEITADLTFLHHLTQDSVPFIYQNFGYSYNSALVINTYIATAREITAHYYAKDLITQREELEKAIYDKLVTSLGKYGIVIETVLVRDIELPTEILQAIKDKVRSEQASLQAQFDIEKQRKELNFAVEKQKRQAEMMIIEAEGIKKSQSIIDSTLSEKQLRYKSLEITKGLVTSPNSKVIISDGKSPLILNASGDSGK